jgi:hypothetical protein
MNDLSGNHFHQLKSANSSGDYLTLKKARYVYNTHKSNTKVNTKTVPYKKGNSHSKLLLYNKGYFQETIRDGSPSLYPYKNAEQCGSKKRLILTKNKLSGVLDLASDASTIDDYYKDKKIKLIQRTATTTLTQVRTITGYTGSTKAFTVQSDFGPDSASGNEYEIFLTDNGTLTF